MTPHYSSDIREENRAPLSRWPERGALNISRRPRGSVALMEEITNDVASRYGVSVSDMMGPSRRREHVLPRFQAMAEIYGTGLFSHPTIGRFFAGRDHTSVMNACRRIAELCNGDIRAAIDTARHKKNHSPRGPAILYDHSEDDCPPDHEPISAPKPTAAERDRKIVDLWMQGYEPVCIAERFAIKPSRVQEAISAHRRSPRALAQQGAT